MWQFYVFKEATLVLLIFLYFYFYLLYSSFCLFWVYVALFFSSFSRLKLSIYLRSSFLLWAFKAINPSMHCFSCTNMLNFHFIQLKIFSHSLCDFLFEHGLFRNVLFNFQIFVDFPSFLHCQFLIEVCYG